MKYFTILNQKLNDTDILFNGKYINLFSENKLNHWDKIFTNDASILILGKPVIDLSEWHNYRDGDKSYVSNILLEKYFKLNLIEFCNSLNGAFTIIVIDNRNKNIILITDRLGMFPVYITGNNLTELQISSHPDILANNSNNNSLDKVSVAEFLMNGFIDTPFTYYKEISVLEHACYTILDFNQDNYKTEKYFNIRVKESNNYNYLKRKLSKSLINAVERRTASSYGKIAVFLSGGSDSRTVLCNSFGNVDAITLYNEINTEINTTRELCRKLNKKHYLIKRKLDHYLDIVQDSVILNGGMSEITSEHYLTFKDNPVFNNYDLFLSGCYFDYMFKALTCNTKKIRIFSKEIPFKIFTKNSNSFYVGSSQISDAYKTKILNRKAKETLFKDNSIPLEYSRFSPLHREHDAVMRLSLIREFEWDLVSADNDLIDCFLQIPPKFKINSRIFDSAVADITKDVGDIPHANKMCKIGTNPCAFVIQRFFRLFKKKGNKNHSSIYGEGSWLNFKEYAKKSDRTNDLWTKIEYEERTIINKILGYDAWSLGKEAILDQDRGTHLLFRIITFSCWHKLKRKGLLLKN